MGRKIVVVVVSLALFLQTGILSADEAALKKQLTELNNLTGSDPLENVLKQLSDNKDQTKELIQFALPFAEKKDLRYNAALVLGLAAAELKELKSSESFLRVCMKQAAALQSTDKLLQSYGGLIELYYENKQYGESARICNELIDLKTDDGKPRIVYRAELTNFGEYDFVEDDSFDSARWLRPTIHQTLIKAIAKQGKYDQALKLIDTLLQEKDHWLERQLKGWVLREAGRNDEAANIYEDVIAKVTKDRDIKGDRRDKYIERYRYELSNLYIEMNKVDKASEQLEYLISKHPREPGFYNDLGYIWADHDMKLEEAEKLIRKALDLDREKRKKDEGYNVKTDHDNGAYLDSLGWILYKQKKLNEAKDVLLKAVEDKKSQHIEIYDHLGDILEALGERQPAIDAWRKGLEVVGEGRREMDRKAAVERKLSKIQDGK